MSVHYPKTYRRYMHYRKKDDVVVVKYGTEWCGPCKEISPVFKDLAKEYPDVYFLDVNIDPEEEESDDSAETNDSSVVMTKHEDFKNVKSIPHFKIFIDRELKKEFHGADKERLMRYIKRYSTRDVLSDN